MFKDKRHIGSLGFLCPDFEGQLLENFPMQLCTIFADVDALWAFQMDPGLFSSRFPSISAVEVREGSLNTDPTRKTPELFCIEIHAIRSKARSDINSRIHCSS